jgi:hypothetical protein
MMLRYSFALTFSSCVLSTTSAFVSIAPQSKLFGLLSTMDDATKGEALYEKGLSSDDDWLIKQFAALESLELPQPTSLSAAASNNLHREHDWFSDALTHGRHMLEGLQIEVGNHKPTTSFFSGILPDLPPLAPSLKSLASYRMEPVHEEAATRLAIDSFKGESIEWFLQATVDPCPPSAVANHNQIGNGSNEWFM